MDLINRIIHALTDLHPTHPMFVHFPIALTGAAFLFILLAYWRKVSPWSRLHLQILCLPLWGQSRLALQAILTI